MAEDKKILCRGCGKDIYQPDSAWNSAPESDEHHEANCLAAKVRLIEDTWYSPKHMETVQARTIDPAIALLRQVVRAERKDALGFVTIRLSYSWFREADPFMDRFKG